MLTLTAQTSQATYPVLLAAGLLQQTGAQLRAQFGDPKILIISDETVARHHLTPLRDALQQSGFSAAAHVIRPGEAEKNADTLHQLYQALHDAQIQRSDLILALGGGVVGDLAGFAAATWLRGIRYVQLPTTILAQVDSALGGKTAIDMPFGKNMVGAFHQPSLVLIDPHLLKTLPQAEVSNGVAEIIKYGCIRDADLFNTLSAHSGRPNRSRTGIRDADLFNTLSEPTAQLDEAIARCVAIKLDIVARDELDTGERQILNFGHTIGHALERLTEYRLLRHGEAVAIGQVIACRIGEQLGITPAGTAEQVARALAAWQLPTTYPAVSATEVFAALQTDKKRAGDRLNFILLDRLGAARIEPLALTELSQLLAQVWP